MRPPGVRVPSRAIARGTVWEVPAEVLPAEALQGGHRGVGAQLGADRVGEQADGLRLVDDRRDAAGVADLRLDAVRRDDGATSSLTRRFGLGPGAGVEIRMVPAARPSEGITLWVAPACTSPHTRVAPARGSSRRDSAAGRPVTRCPSAKVRSWVRWGREVWPPCPESSTSTASAAPVSGPTLRPTVPSRGWVAVQGVGADGVVERSLRHQPLRPARHDLLGGLEEQPHAARQRRARVELGERQRGAQQRGGVDVVAAGVGHARDRAGPGLPRPVGQRQRVDVRAQHHHGPVGPDLRDQPRRLGQPVADPGRGQPLRDGARRTPLLPGQLGVGVQVTPERDQLLGGRESEVVAGGARSCRLPVGLGLPAARPVGVVRREEPVRGLGSRHLGGQHGGTDLLAHLPYAG